MTAPKPDHPLRRIEPVSIAGLKPRAPATGKPIVEYVNPRDLFIDPAYQRGIGEHGLRQIRKIVEEFDWAKFKLPTACYATNHAGETCLFVLDGQHTAIACASHPDIDQIPVAIVEAETVEAQADAFIGLNMNRLRVTPLQLHHAAVTAASPEAVTIEQVCERAGITIPRGTSGSAKFNRRETIAVAAIGELIGRRGALRAREVLDVLAKTDLAPIEAKHLKAIELLLTDADFATISVEDLPTTINAMRHKVDDEAALMAKTHRVPKWRAIASIWFRNGKKRRKPLGLEQNPSHRVAGKPTDEQANGSPRNPLAAGKSASRPLAAFVAPVRPAIPHKSLTSAIMGDPEPGRSALDERNGGKAA